ncbi:hypothetical protein MMC06_000564 [Schaereria dolodes]|nr:hypothetical protein [Schaereria dolodes]
MYIRDCTVLIAVAFALVAPVSGGNGRIARTTGLITIPWTFIAGHFVAISTPAVQALPHHQSPPKGNLSWTEESCAGWEKFHCDATTDVRDCDTAISQVCTYATGNDGYAQNTSGLIQESVGTDNQSCVVTVYLWDSSKVGKVGYDECVTNFQQISMNCLNTQLSGQQKGGGGSINVPVDYPLRSFDVTSLSNPSLPQYFLRSAGCDPQAALGWPPFG